MHEARDGRRLLQGLVLRLFAESQQQLDLLPQAQWLRGTKAEFRETAELGVS